MEPARIGKAFFLIRTEAQLVGLKTKLSRTAGGLLTENTTDLFVV